MFSKQSSNKKGFNLLRPQISPENKWDIIYKYVNNTARIILVAVELVVIVCFAVRVVIDRQARDLTKRLDANRAELDALKTQEDEIRLIQEKTSFYKSSWESKTKLLEAHNEILNFNTALYSELNISIDEDGTLSVSAEIPIDDIQDYETKFKQSSQIFNDIVLLSFIPDLENQEESTEEIGTFNLTAKIKDFNRDLIN